MARRTAHERHGCPQAGPPLPRRGRNPLRRRRRLRNLPLLDLFSFACLTLRDHQVVIKHAALFTSTILSKVLQVGTLSRASRSSTFLRLYPKRRRRPTTFGLASPPPEGSYIPHASFMPLANAGSNWSSVNVFLKQRGCLSEWSSSLSKGKLGVGRWLRSYRQLADQDNACGASCFFCSNDPLPFLFFSFSPSAFSSPTSNVSYWET